MSLIKKIFGGLWSFINTIRKVVFGLIALVIFIAFIAGMFGSEAPVIANKTALVIKPQGRLVEQLTEKTVDQLVDEARGIKIEETLLKDVIDAINAAKDDKRVKVLVLDFSAFGGAHLTKLQDMAKAIDEFKTSGKKVVANADFYTQDSYYLAAHADEVIINKMGGVILQGFARYKTFYKEGIDKLGLDINVFKVGTFKSAIEPFVRNDMSEYAKEANREWMGDLWKIYINDVAAARGMEPSVVDRYAQEINQLITEKKGDSGKLALDYGLADKAMTRVEVQDYLIELAGEDKITHSFNRVGMNGYLATLKDDRFGRTTKGDKVAVVVARGMILDGSQPAGKIGGDSTAALIRKARKDDSVKAIVLRVDSGGGSAFASEVIRRELEKARADGKPVITSMGSVAASGGYWISTSSDQIWAQPSTITGSIGIFGMFPTYQKPLAKHLGIRVDGISTAPASSIRPDRELPAEFGSAFQVMIEKGYQEFLQRVADARDMTTEEVDKIAQGRVWSGEDAHRLGLVDTLGDLEGAVAAAAELAGISESYTVSYIEKEQELKDKILNEMLGQAVSLSSQTGYSISPVESMLREVERVIGDFKALNDPNNIYVLSNIETD